MVGTSRGGGAIGRRNRRCTTTRLAPCSSSAELPLGRWTTAATSGILRSWTRASRSTTCRGLGASHSSPDARLGRWSVPWPGGATALAALPRLVVPSLFARLTGPRSIAVELTVVPGGTPLLANLASYGGGTANIGLNSGSFGIHAPNCRSALPGDLARTAHNDGTESVNSRCPRRLRLGWPQRMTSAGDDCHADRA